MRVTGGSLRGRILNAGPDGGIRPTSDKVRLALFNIVMPMLEKSDPLILDLFCGSGSLGIEALSRLPDSTCVFVDQHPKSLAISRKNIMSLELDRRASFIKDDAAGLQKTEGQYGLVFLDPPYKRNLVPPCLESLVQKNLAAHKCIVAIESEITDIFAPTGFAVLKTRVYGETQITILSNKPV